MNVDAQGGDLAKALDVIRREARAAADRADALEASLRALQQRFADLELRLLGYHRHRWDAIDKVMDYLVGAELPGDYVEFGVFQGATFAFAVKRMSEHLPGLRFVALDSFEGLPPPAEADVQQGYSSGFTQGQFNCSKAQFLANLAEFGAPLDRVLTFEGWFDQSLRPGGAAAAAVSHVAAAWIDCDLYASTVPVLDFLTPRLSVGSVLVFDDWRCFRNSPDMGEQRACREWLERNPGLALAPFIDFGFHGVAFTVASLPR
jgi:hypothetical protein